MVWQANGEISSNHEQPGKATWQGKDKTYIYNMYKEDETNENGNNAMPWFILCHLNPTWIESMLRKDCEGQFLAPNAPQLPPYQLYIPYHYMPLPVKDGHVDDQDLKDYDPIQDMNGLRSDLHNFVFIQAAEGRVEQIVKSDWNRKTRLHLYYYRNPEGEKVTIPDVEMQQLIKTLQDHHLTFYFDQPIVEFVVGVAVMLQMDPWRGKRGIIKAITVKKDRTDITVSLNIFNRTKSINFKGVNVGDVQFEDEHRGKLLSGNPITNYEEEIIDILSHRFTQKRIEEVVESDRYRLKRLSTYSHIFVEDSDDAARFIALKLLCSYLREEKRKVEHHIQEVQTLLEGKTTPETDRDAYLMMALFIATRNPQLRDAVKTYRTTHPNSPDILRRYHTIVKNLKTTPPR